MDRDRVPVRLRRAKPEDEELLLSWANDPQVRAMACRQAAIAVSEHRAWFEGKLADPACRIYIAERDGVPVGQVRLDRVGETAEIDISVAAAERGRGVGLAMLLAPVLADWPGLERFRAAVRRENAASRAVFRAAGFDEVGSDEAYVYFTKPVSDAAAR